MITCSRKIHFCSGHRVMNHESKCANIHGHNYVMWIYAKAPELDGLGRVIDFSVLKERIGGWVDKYWDHTFIAYEKDKELIADLKKYEKTSEIFLSPVNPTAENMADYMLRKVAPALMRGTGIEIYKIKLYETENCYAEATL